CGIRYNICNVNAELIEFELHEMVKLATIDNDINNCLDDNIVAEINKNNNI
ncbi:40152_t:CDS:1, partial [Gigaspora margarita]